MIKDIHSYDTFKNFISQLPLCKKYSLRFWCYLQLKSVFRINACTWKCFNRIENKSIISLETSFQRTFIFIFKFQGNIIVSVTSIKLEYLYKLTLEYYISPREPAKMLSKLSLKKIVFNIRCKIGNSLKVHRHFHNIKMNLYSKNDIQVLYFFKIKLASLTNLLVTMENVFRNAGYAIKKMTVEMVQMKWNARMIL